MLVVSRSLKETENIAKRVLLKLQDKDVKAAQINVLALVGELGSGKTAFVQAVGRVLGIKEQITSPTFILMRSYLIPLAGQQVLGRLSKFFEFERLYHLDLYRLESWVQVKSLGIEEIWQDSKNLVCIEWAGKIRKHLPRNCFWVSFQYLGERSRRIALEDRGWRMEGGFRRWKIEDR